MFKFKLKCENKGVEAGLWRYRFSNAIRNVKHKTAHTQNKIYLH